MPEKPDEQLPSRYHRPQLRVQSPRAGERASGAWSPACGSAVHVRGKKMRTRFSPGRRPRAGVRSPGAGVPRPGVPRSGVRSPASRSGLRFRTSEVRGPNSEVVGETLRCAALKRPCLLGADIRSTSLGTPASMLSQAACSMRPFEHHQTGLGS